MWDYKKLKCPKCEYTWLYKGEHWNTKCPKCYKNMSVKDNRTNGEKKDV